MTALRPNDLNFFTAASTSSLVVTVFGIVFFIFRASNFDEAKETAESLIPYVNDLQLKKIVSYELQLIQTRDDMPRLVSEVQS